VSRGHQASRRRNYGPRQRDVRRRAARSFEVDPPMSEWPGGSAWSEGYASADVTHELLHRRERGEAA